MNTIRVVSIKDQRFIFWLPGFLRTFANGTTVKALRLYGFGFGLEREFSWGLLEEVKRLDTEGTEERRRKSEKDGGVLPQRS